MTRYISKARCRSCGEPHWFRYWVGRNCDRSTSGLCVGDFDLTFHRFWCGPDAIGNRTVEHLMVVEVKVGDERLTPAQHDTLSVFNSALKKIIPISGEPLEIAARPGYIRKGTKKIVWHGIHLLRVPFLENEDGPFFWNNYEINRQFLAEILDFKRDPYHPECKLDINRRHKKKRKFRHRELFGDS